MRQWDSDPGDLWQWSVVWWEPSTGWVSSQPLCLQLGGGVWGQTCWQHSHLHSRMRVSVRNISQWWGMLCLLHQVCQWYPQRGRKWYDKWRIPTYPPPMSRSTVSLVWLMIIVSTPVTGLIYWWSMPAATPVLPSETSDVRPMMSSLLSLRDSSPSLGSLFPRIPSCTSSVLMEFHDWTLVQQEHSSLKQHSVARNNDDEPDMIVNSYLLCFYFNIWRIKHHQPIHQ